MSFRQMLPRTSQRRGAGCAGTGRFPGETVGIGERRAAAEDDDAVRAGAVRGNADVFGCGSAAVQRQLHRRVAGVELDVLAAEALGDGQTVPYVELLGRRD